MGTEKRQRKKEGRQARLEAERAAAVRAQRRRRLVTAAVATLAVFAVLVLLAGRAGDDEGTTEAGDGTTTTEEPATTDTVDPADKPEVQVPDGDPPTDLVVEDLEEGDGQEATAGDTLEVHYVGVSFSTGEEFDSSWNRGQVFPFELGAGRVIRGWDEGLEGMRVGGRRQLIIPSDLAYGAQGSPPAIGPEETLIFVVDLVGIS
ncbi:MAG TPA: FKBP-type peptidyl-prolyl cis-trans isomerase [Acidimicrobiales bacterium]|nr:FKBP-type peptidyl-prolyl cis-trans isomerase [Acidimicrobiales bacterium]